MFVRNSWYVAAWSDEVGHRSPLARTIVGERLVMFRTADGNVSILEDRCAHRRMPLSPGRLTPEGKIICPYHGLTYDGTGACVLVPGQSGPNDIRVRAFSAHENAGLIWVWMGDPKNADTDKIFDCSWFERANWQETRLYRHAKANYLLLNDNLADLLHVAYLHIPSGGGNEFMGPAETDLKSTSDGYRFIRETKNIPSPTGYSRLSNAKGNIDRWHIVDFKAPSFFRIYTGVAETGTGGPESPLPQGKGKWTIAPHHFITPETENTTHYFQIVAHEWLPSSDSWRFLNSVIDEDVWAIEQQQVNIDIEPEAPFVAIGSDQAMYAMRKIVDSMLSADSEVRC